MNKNKKILIISLGILSITLLCIFLIFKVSTNHMEPMKKSNYITPSKDISIKNRITKNVEITKEENKRLEKIKEYSQKPKNLSPQEDTDNGQNINPSKIVVDSYFLFKNDYLNINQFISLKERLNLGVNEINSVKIQSDVDNYYNINKEGFKDVLNINSSDDLRRFKDKFGSLEKITKAIIIENSVKKDLDTLSFDLELQDSSNKKQIVNINVILDEKTSIINWLSQNKSEKSAKK